MFDKINKTCIDTKEKKCIAFELLMPLDAKHDLNRLDLQLYSFKFAVVSHDLGIRDY